MVVRRIQVDGTEDARQVDRAQLRVHERREEAERAVVGGQMRRVR